MSVVPPREIAVPTDVSSDVSAFELARVWDQGGQQVYVLQPPADFEPGMWGLIAMDLLRHAARAHEARSGITRQEAYKEMLLAFAMEMKNPTEPL